MNFTTQIPIPKTSNPIDYNSRIVSLGSCFAKNIAEKFEYFKFQNIVNPFGIIFNTVSIERIVNRIVNQELFTENDIFFHNDLWHCYEVHSELSHPDKEEFLNNLNEIIESANLQISKATHIIITYGTSWVYRNIDTNEIVSNCHKVPQKQFTKELLSVETNARAIKNTIDLITNINKNAKFIFTVSPVRHIKDGFVENNLSKAHLISALYQTINHQQSTINYFPSYEILLDELRDYRFYSQDMLHPNQLAIDYIWQRFFKTQISESIYSVMEDVCSIQKDLAHKPFNPNSEKHQHFLSKLRDKIAKLVVEYPFMKFE
ncbi:GSCFA domain-containing protein [Flavobacterium sp.]|uniref:GSCFA domain-containing protein n=1 Tax=Flavobacterium sp. TaxID=239 RepID=UPI00286BF18A|nr:GSCFA domain-containing protein [Flavobacterium sp.]